MNFNRAIRTLRAFHKPKFTTTLHAPTHVYRFQATLTTALRRRNFSTTPDPNQTTENYKSSQWKFFRESAYMFKLFLVDLYYKDKRRSYILMLLFGSLLYVYLNRDSYYSELSFNELLSHIENAEFERLVIKKYFDAAKLQKCICLLRLNGAWSRTEVLDYDELIEAINSIKDKAHKKSIEYELKSAPNSFMDNWEAILLISLVVALMLKTRASKGTKVIGDLDMLNKNYAKKFTKEMNINKSFKDVAGMDQAKQEISEFVDFLKNPKKYTDMGAKLPRGALLSGPPGTGKTLLAKACAGEAGVPFYFVSGSEFVELFVGMGASRVRSLFQDAKKHAPAIIFIDEIDAIGKKRSMKLSSNSEQESTLNQILVEMDGFGTSSKVIVFAATNRKELLDPALTRPGRFDRSIDVSLPDLDGRRQIFLVHLAPLKLHPNSIEKHAKRLASLTPGFSGADIANICNEAAIQAVRSHAEFVADLDFEVAVERVIGGLEKKRNASVDERRVVAVHESGHGVVAWFLEGAAPLLKLTIIPRSKGSLGFAQYLPNEVSLETKSEMENRIIAVLAGRCAEEAFFGRVTTGAYDDLQKASKLAHTIVTKLGMTDRIGLIALEENQYGMKPYSDITNEEIDEECRMIIQKCTEKCKELIKKHYAQIEALSDLLLEKETIDLRQIMSVLGERPFPLKPGFKAYLNEIA